MGGVELAGVGPLAKCDVGDLDLAGAGGQVELGRSIGGWFELELGASHGVEILRWRGARARNWRRSGFGFLANVGRNLVKGFTLTPQFAVIMVSDQHQARVLGHGDEA